ncbi:MAG: hypothetical protein LBF78_08810 [Treponema sp.]|jgi:hypothetical protein|nr:hypothetical protein [Treponema sp.]
MGNPFLVFCFCLLLFSCAGVPDSAERLSEVKDRNPVLLGEITIETNDSFFSAGKNEAVQVSVYWYPGDNAAALEIPFQYIKFLQYWDKSAREVFFEAFKSFKKDLEELNFNLSGAKARRAYGSIRGLTEWRSLPVTGAFKAFPYYEFGYHKAGDAVFFTIIQTDAEEVTFSSMDLESPRIAALFTPAQAESLAEIFGN